MNCEVKIKNYFRADDGFIEDNLGNLSMSSFLTAHLFIGWVTGVSTCITTFNIDDSLELGEGRVKAPETATGKYKFSHVSSLGLIREQSGK
jgi:hypothetical protein